MSLETADGIEITVLMDNVIDSFSKLTRKDALRPSQWVEKRGPHLGHLRASHGLSVLVRVRRGSETRTILYDTGESGEVLSHNLKILGLSLQNIEAIVISHGHWDHTGGLLWVLQEIARDDTLVYIHPRALVPRAVTRTTESGETLRRLEPVPTRSEIVETGGKLMIDPEPTLLADGMLLLSGEIPRRTDYEKGFTGQKALVDGQWVDDSLVVDDRVLIAKVKEKGLVVVTGCSHAGIVNISHEATRLTGTATVHAIVGGFHLIGPDSATRIPHTTEDLREISPEVIVPCHCTGWRAQHALAKVFPEAYINNGVGNLYKF